MKFQYRHTKSGAAGVEVPLYQYVITVKRNWNPARRDLELWGEWSEEALKTAFLTMLMALHGLVRGYKDFKDVIVSLSLRQGCQNWK